VNEGLYNKQINCPVCNEKFEITKVKSKACKISSRDTDFCIYYEGINPILYDIFVCGNCGYAAQADKFETISLHDADIVLKDITPKWHKRSFVGERNIDNALVAFKLALYNLQLRMARNSDIAKLCLRIAWLYRLNKDNKEHEFLEFALRAYTNAFQTENFPIEKLDENTCMFMIGELNRRVGKLEESVKWFSRLISSPEARQKPTLMDSARDQFQLVKEQLSKEQNHTTKPA
jgi:uncharacterized protein